jgi:hypothetical protein
MAGFCEHCNEHLGSIMGEEFPNQLSVYKLLKKDSTTQYTPYLHFLLSWMFAVVLKVKYKLVPVLNEISPAPWYIWGATYLLLLHLFGRESDPPWWKSPRYPLDRRCMVPRTGLDDVEWRKSLTIEGLELLSLGHAARNRYSDCPCRLKRVLAQIPSFRIKPCVIR